MLSKNLRFKQLARINLLAMVISACASLAMAFTGCEVWTLAWQPVILAGSRTILLWCQGDWRPRGGFRFAAIRELLPFASGLLFASLLNTLFLNVYGFVIGKIYPILQMSYYTQGSRTADMGVTTLYGTIQSATYPIFSSIQDDRARLIRSYRKTMRVTAFATFPVMAALVVSAPALFDLLLKDEWLPAVPFFRWLCVGGCFTILCAINNNFIKVSGRSDAILKLEYCIIALTAVAVIATMRHDVLTMVTGLVAVRIAVYLINIWFTARHTGYAMLAQLRDIAPYLLLAVVSAAVAMFVGKLFTGCILTLAAQFLSLAAVYLLLALLLGSKVVKESFQILFSRRRDG
jgi:O-antigen/teichoic acid export membrane protein